MRKVINHYDNIGKKFNKLTIIDVKRKTYGKKNSWAYYYVCKCDCGNIKDVRSDFVLDNMIKSCGCYKKTYERSDAQKERVKEMGIKNRKHEEKCEYCGAPNHFAKGLCHNCYERNRRNGTLEYVRKKEEN